MIQQEELSPQETAQILGVTRKTVYRMRNRGEFPHAYKQKHRIWIPRSDIEAYLQHQQKGFPETTVSPSELEFESGTVPPPLTLPEPAIPIQVTEPPTEVLQSEEVPLVEQQEPTLSQESAVSAQVAELPPEQVKPKEVSLAEELEKASANLPPPQTSENDDLYIFEEEAAESLQELHWVNVHRVEHQDPEFDEENRLKKFLKTLWHTLGHHKD